MDFINGVFGDATQQTHRLFESLPADYHMGEAVKRASSAVFLLSQIKGLNTKIRERPDLMVIVHLERIAV
jgi:hypothetical protein